MAQVTSSSVLCQDLAHGRNLLNIYLISYKIKLIVLHSIYLGGTNLIFEKLLPHNKHYMSLLKNVLSHLDFCPHDI